MMKIFYGDNDNFIYDDNGIDQENVQIEAENRDISYHRKLLTKNRLVNSITKPPQNLGQPRQCDVVKEAFGVRGEAKNINSEVGAFSLFVSDEILNIIVQNINKQNFPKKYYAIVNILT